MKVEKDGNPLRQFPIRGDAVSRYLTSVLPSDEVCVVSAIETLCSNNCTELGALWKRVVATRSERLAAQELAGILTNADQVVTLDLRTADDPARSLLIEDGEVVESRLNVQLPSSNADS